MSLFVHYGVSEVFEVLYVYSMWVYERRAEGSAISDDSLRGGRNREENRRHHTPHGTVRRGPQAGPRGRPEESRGQHTPSREGKEEFSRGGKSLNKQQKFCNGSGEKPKRTSRSPLVTFLVLLYMLDLHGLSHG